MKTSKREHDSSILTLQLESVNIFVKLDLSNNLKHFMKVNNSNGLHVGISVFSALLSGTFA